MKIFDANGVLDRAAVIAIIKRGDAAEVAAAHDRITETVWREVAGEAKHEQLQDAAIQGLATEIEGAMAAIAAAGTHLRSLTSGDAYHGDYDSYQGSEMLKNLGAADEALRAAQLANPIDLAAEEQKQLLADAAEYLTPCPPPDMANGYDLDPHGSSWPCEQTKLAWRLRRLDPDAEYARIMREVRAELAMAYPPDPDDEN